MSLVYWDANLFIYLMEEHPLYAPKVQAIRTRMLDRGDQLCTSAFALGEVLAGTYISGNEEFALRYKAVLRPPGVEIIDFDRIAADHYARIRTDPSITRPDALHLACAASAKVDLFLTNDVRLKKKFVRGIQFISDLDGHML